MYLMTSTRCGISAKQLERELGVTYKTAWRMFNLIRNELMDAGRRAAVGRSRDGRDVRRRQAAPVHSERGSREGLEHADRVLGVARRSCRGCRAQGSDSPPSVVPNSRASTILPLAREYVLPPSLIYTDEYFAYTRLGKEGYRPSAGSSTRRASTSRATRTRKPSTASSACSRMRLRGVHHARLAQVAPGLPERVRLALEPQGRRTTACSSTCSTQPLVVAPETRRPGSGLPSLTLSEWG